MRTNWKILTCWMICLCMTSQTFAQETLVKGVLVDSLTRKGEPYAGIRIYSIANRQKPVAMGTTDANGIIRQTVEGRGSYVLLISSVGRTPLEVTLNLQGEPVLDLDTLFIHDDVQQLQGVEIVAQKPLVKMEADRMSYNVSNDTDAKTYTLLDMLRKVPMVSVDGNDQITVNGSSTFKVYVNGKPNAMMSSNPSEIFKSMPASAVSHIEVITSPGAKYDAEGAGGILNLITDRTRHANATGNGYNGNLNVTASNKGLLEGGFFNMQQGKFSLSAQANASQLHIDGMEIAFNREQEGDSGTDFTFGQLTNDTDIDLISGSLNAAYEIDSLNSVSASVSLMKSDNASQSVGDVRFEGIHYPNPSGYSLSTHTDNAQTSVFGSIDYQHTFDRHPQQTLTLAYQLTNIPARNNSYNTFDTQDFAGFPTLPNRNSRIKNHSWDHTWQADYSMPLKLQQQLDAGLKYILRKNSSTSDYYLEEEGQPVYDASNSLDYQHNSQILAAYLEYRRQFDRLSFTAGLRYEHTWQCIGNNQQASGNFRKNYGNWVPNAQLSFSIGERQNIGTTYNLRISRPGINYLNPYIDRSDPTALTYGNSSLTSEELHVLSLVYNYSTARCNVNLTIRQQISNNGISAYSFYQDGLLHNTYGNIVKSQQSGLNAFVNWNAGPQTRFTLNGGITYADFRSHEQNLHTYGWQGNGMFSFQQTLPGDLRLSLTLMGSSKQYNLQGWSTGFSACMGSLSRSFCNNHLHLSLTGMTPFTGSKLHLKTFSEGTGFHTHSEVKIPLQAYYFNISYTFGKQIKPRNMKRKNRDTDIKSPESSAEKIRNFMIH